MNLSKICFVIFFIFSSIAFSQTDSLSLDEDLDLLVEESAEDVEDEELYEYLDQLRDNPVDLNNSSINDLLKIPFLDFNSASEIIKYRKENGKFKTENSLYEIKTISRNLIDRIIPFVSIYENRFSKLFLPFEGELRSRIVTDLQERKGFIDKKFIGNKYKTYNRIKLSSGNNFRINALAEKDAGENNYNDFNSYSISAENLSVINKLILGDYLAEFGQGLVLWSPYGFGKSSASIATVRKSDRTFIPYTSSDENRYFRGVAANLKFGNFKVGSFYSNKKIDARIDTISGAINSIPIDGYHRTESELFKKNKLEEKIFGVRTAFTLFKNFNFGLLYFRENLADQTDKNFYSFSYSFLFENLMISGEEATEGKNFSGILNASIKVNKNLGFLTSYRNYSNKFLSRFANAVSEGSNPKNEEGFYTGLEIKSMFGKTIIYYDLFRFPESSFYSNFPAGGNEISIFHEFRPVKRVKMRLNFKSEKKEVEEVVQSRISVVNRIRTKYKTDLIYRINKFLRFKSRIEFVDFKLDKKKETGFLIYQDLNYKHSRTFSFYGRIIFFKAESYDSRLYEFENDLIGIMYNPALYGEGIRWYLMFKYRLFEGFILSAKYSETYKPKEKFLSSGLMQIDNNLDNRINLQLDIYF